MYGIYTQKKYTISKWRTELNKRRRPACRLFFLPAPFRIFVLVTHLPQSNLLCAYRGSRVAPAQNPNERYDYCRQPSSVCYYTGYWHISCIASLTSFRQKSKLKLQNSFQNIFTNAVVFCPVTHLHTHEKSFNSSRISRMRYQMKGRLTSPIRI